MWYVKVLLTREIWRTAYLWCRYSIKDGWTWPCSSSPRWSVIVFWISGKHHYGKKDNLNCDFLFGRIFEPRFCIQKCQSAVQPTIARWNVDREKYRPWAGMPFSHTSTASNPLSLVIHVYHVLAAGFLFFSKQVWLIKAMSHLYDVLHLLQ